MDKSIAGRLEASKKIDIELNTGTCSSLFFKMQYKNIARKWLINAEKQYMGRLEWIIIESAQQGIGDEIRKMLAMISSKSFVFLPDIYRYKI